MFFFRYLFLAQLSPPKSEPKPQTPNPEPRTKMSATTKSNLSAKYTQIKVCLFAVLTQSVSSGLITPETMTAILRDYLAFFDTVDQQTSVFDGFCDKDFVKNVQTNIKVFVQASALDTQNTDIVSRIVANASVPCIQEGTTAPAKKPRAPRAKKSVPETIDIPSPAAAAAAAADDSSDSSLSDLSEAPAAPKKKPSRAKANAKPALLDLDAEAPVDEPKMQKKPRASKKTVVAQNKDAVVDAAVVDDALVAADKKQKKPRASKKPVVDEAPVVVDEAPVVVDKKQKKPRASKKPVVPQNDEAESEVVIPDRVPTPVLTDDDGAIQDEDELVEESIEETSIGNIMQTIEFDGVDYLLHSDLVRVFSNTNSGTILHIGNLVDDSIVFI